MAHNNIQIFMIIGKQSSCLDVKVYCSQCVISFVVSGKIGKQVICTIPQKRLPEGEQMKLSYKVCFPLIINEEGLPVDDEVKKVGKNMTSTYLFQPSKLTIFYKNCSSKNML